MNIEALLKLKTQMALASGDYGMVKHYADQLQMLESGWALEDLPISEEFEQLKSKYRIWLDDTDTCDIVSEFKSFYGNDLYSVVQGFFLEFSSAELCDVISK